MKVTVFCLIMLALVAHADQANWAGKWLAQFNHDTVCAPAGIVTITHAADGKTNVKGTWDPLGPICKAFELSGQAIDVSDGVLTDNSLTLKVKSKNNTEITVAFTRTGTENKIDVSYTTDSTKTSSIPTGIVTDEALKKVNEWKGSYSFKITEGDADKCCIPDSLEFGDAANAVFYVTGKYAASKGCEAIGVKDAKFEKYATDASDQSFTWHHKVSSGLGIFVVGHPQKDKPEVQYQSVASDQVCKVTVTKGSAGSKWWIWVIVVIVILAVGAGVYVFMQKRKAQNSGYGASAYARA